MRMIALWTWKARRLRMGAALAAWTVLTVLTGLVPTRSAHAQPQTMWRATSTPAEQALDAAAFQGLDAPLTEQFTDVQSAVVLLRGRVVYTFYRDGDAQKLRSMQSVSKSALSALVGTAIAQGHIASVDQRVVDLLPDWATLNADPRASGITLRHLLTMTTGFAINDASGTAAPLSPRDAWARPLTSAPGQTFAYDNSVLPLVTAVLEKATAMPLPDYARQQLVVPLALAEPAYPQGRLSLRTVDMAKLGQLYLQNGVWDGQRLLPEDFVNASTHAQNAGGRPVGRPYGYLWWVLASQAPRSSFMAVGFGGQYIWVYPPLDLVVATTSTASFDSNRRGHALQFIRRHAFAAAQQRMEAEPRP